MSEDNLMSAEAADKLLACADGRAALLYLHILRSGGFSLTAAARVLRCSETETALAADTLRRLGLLTKPQSPLQEAELPPVRAEDIVARAETDGAFKGLVVEAERALGRVLSSHDLEVLFGIYDHLGLPADVIMVLLNHCVEECRTRSGPGRMPTMRTIEKEAWFWAEQEILNLDAAEEHLRRCREKKEAAAQVKEALQIRGRELTASERKYVERWISMGFGADAVAVAYDRTVLRTGKMNWKYMDRILESWDGRGLHSPDEIEAKDPAQRTQQPAAAAVSNSDKIDRMRRVYDSMKKTGGQREA